MTLNQFYSVLAIKEKMCIMSLALLRKTTFCEIFFFYHKRGHNVCNKHTNIHLHIILKPQLYLAQFVFGGMLKCLT